MKQKTPPTEQSAATDAPPSANLALWDAVSHTDPAYTKPFTLGNAQLTAINPTYLIRKITEALGLPGVGWGYEIKDEEYREGALLPCGNREVTHSLRVEMWYVWNGQKGQVTQFGDTIYVGHSPTAGRAVTDHGARKKSLTDALTKCMSLLGFSADIFMGTYDDNKNVSSPTVAPAGLAGDGPLSVRFRSYSDQIASASPGDLENIKVMINVDGSLRPDERATLLASATSRQATAPSEDELQAGKFAMPV